MVLVAVDDAVVFVVVGVAVHIAAERLPEPSDLA